MTEGTRFRPMRLAPGDLRWDRHAEIPTTAQVLVYTCIMNDKTLPLAARGFNDYTRDAVNSALVGVSRVTRDTFLHIGQRTSDAPISTDSSSPLCLMPRKFTFIEMLRPRPEDAAERRLRVAATLTAGGGGSEDAATIAERLVLQEQPVGYRIWIYLVSPGEDPPASLRALIEENRAAHAKRVRGVATTDIATALNMLDSGIVDPSVIPHDFSSLVGSTEVWAQALSLYLGMDVRRFLDGALAPGTGLLLHPTVLEASTHATVASPLNPYFGFGPEVQFRAFSHAAIHPEQLNIRNYITALTVGGRVGSKFMCPFAACMARIPHGMAAARMLGMHAFWWESDATGVGATNANVQATLRGGYGSIFAAITDDAELGRQMLASASAASVTRGEWQGLRSYRQRVTNAVHASGHKRKSKKKKRGGRGGRHGADDDEGEEDDDEGEAVGSDDEDGAPRHRHLEQIVMAAAWPDSDSSGEDEEEEGEEGDGGSDAEGAPPPAAAEMAALYVAIRKHHGPFCTLPPSILRRARRLLSATPMIDPRILGSVEMGILARAASDLNAGTGSGRIATGSAAVGLGRLGDMAVRGGGTPTRIPEIAAFMDYHRGKLRSDPDLDPAIRLAGERDLQLRGVAFLRRAQLPPAMAAVQDWIQKYLTSRRAAGLPAQLTANMGVHATKELSSFGDFFFRCMYLIPECFFSLLCAHGMYAALIHACWTAWTDRCEYTNFIMEGPACASKSYLVELLQAILIPGTWRPRSGLSAQANTVAVDDNHMVMLWQEMAAGQMGAAADGKQSAIEAKFMDQYKDLTSSGEVTVEHCSMQKPASGEGVAKRVLVSTTYKCNGTHIYCTNAGTGNMPEAVVSRHQVTSMPHSERITKAIHSIRQLDWADPDVRDAQEACHVLNAHVAMLNMLNNAHIFVSPCTRTGATMFADRFAAAAKKLGLSTGLPRHRQATFAMAEQTVFAFNAYTHFIAPGAAFAAADWSLEQYLELDPKLYITEEQIATITSLTFGQHVTSGVSDVMEGILTFVREDPSPVSEAGDYLMTAERRSRLGGVTASMSDRGIALSGRVGGAPTFVSHADAIAGDAADAAAASGGRDAFALPPRDSALDDGGWGAPPPVARGVLLQPTIESFFSDVVVADDIMDVAGAVGAGGYGKEEPLTVARRAERAVRDAAAADTPDVDARAAAAFDTALEAAVVTTPKLLKAHRWSILVRGPQKDGQLTFGEWSDMLVERMPTTHSPQAVARIIETLKSARMQVQTNRFECLAITHEREEKLAAARTRARAAGTPPPSLTSLTAEGVIPPLPRPVMATERVLTVHNAGGWKSFAILRDAFRGGYAAPTLLQQILKASRYSHAPEQTIVLCMPEDPRNAPYIPMAYQIKPDRRRHASYADPRWSSAALRMTFDPAMLREAHIRDAVLSTNQSHARARELRGAAAASVRGATAAREMRAIFDAESEDEEEEGGGGGSDADEEVYTTRSSAAGSVAAPATAYERAMEGHHMMASAGSDVIDTGVVDTSYDMLTVCARMRVAGVPLTGDRWAGMRDMFLVGLPAAQTLIARQATGLPPQFQLSYPSAYIDMEKARLAAPKTRSLAEHYDVSTSTSAAVDAAALVERMTAAGPDAVSGWRSFASVLRGATGTDSTASEVEDAARVAELAALQSRRDTAASWRPACLSARGTRDDASRRDMEMRQRESRAHVIAREAAEAAAEAEASVDERRSPLAAEGSDADSDAAPLRRRKRRRPRVAPSPDDSGGEGSGFTDAVMVDAEAPTSAPRRPHKRARMRAAASPTVSIERAVGRPRFGLATAADSMMIDTLV